MDGRTQEGDDFVSVEHDHEFLNTDKSNLALQTQYFTDSLKNFNDIAVHSKMMLELIAKRILGQPKVIPTVYLTDGDFSPPVDEVVSIRAMVMSTQTTPVVITVNGIIPIIVSTVPTQIVTGPISSVTVGNTVSGNPVYVQYMDERAAALNNETSQDEVSLTGSSAPLSAPAKTTVTTLSYSDFAASATYYGFLNSVLSPNARKRLIAMAATTPFNQPLTWVKTGVYDSTMLPALSDSDVVEISEAAVNLPINTNSSNTDFAGSETYPALIEIGDSLFFAITAGATAPTAGELAVQKREVF